MRKSACETHKAPQQGIHKKGEKTMRNKIQKYLSGERERPFQVLCKLKKLT